MNCSFSRQWTLQNAGPVDQAEDTELSQEDVLLVAWDSVVSWEEDHSQFGANFVSMYPAYMNGEQRWLKQSVWQPAWGYSARGTQDELLGYGSGIVLMVKHEFYGWGEPRSDKASMPPTYKRSFSSGQDIILVATRAVLIWMREHECRLYPAYQNGNQVWMLRSDDYEELLPLTEGCEHLIKHGAFSFEPVTE